MNYAELFNEVREAAEAPRVRALRLEGAGLSDEQQTALDAPFDRSAIVRAGAGAGKTRLLVQRAAALVRAGADPARIAVVTFTRKSAQEIRTRLFTQFGDRTRVPVCGTVHSLALTRLASQKIAPAIASPDELTYFLDLLREELPEDYLELSDAELLLELNRVREEENPLSTSGIIAARFEEMLEEEEVVDFTSLLKLAAEQVTPVFDHILVDEAQDLSSLQKSFLKKIGRASAKYWFIGDGDQAIYAFRGAHGSVMDELAKECDDQYILSVNYRSATSIIEHANNVISQNSGRYPIQWKAHRQDSGLVMIEHFDHGSLEMEAVRHWLTERPGRAVLGRTQAIIAPLRDAELPAFTVHESKGLEWPEVWVVGCEASLFPHPLGVREEERRLFYVAMTRARDTLRMSYASARSEKNPKPGVRHPSAFLFEAHSLEV